MSCREANGVPASYQPLAVAHRAAAALRRAPTQDLRKRVAADADFRPMTAPSEVRVLHGTAIMGVEVHHSIRHLPVLQIFALLAVAGCRPGDPPNGPPEIPADDAAGSSDASVENRVAELAGTWHGEVETEEHGRVRAVVQVTGDGEVSYEVVGVQPTRHFELRIARFDGRILSVVDRDGNQYELSADLDGDTLTLQIPTVGEVVLERR